MFFFLQLHNYFCKSNNYYEQKKKTKCAYAIGLSSLQKTVVAMRMLSLGTPSKVQK